MDYDYYGGGHEEVPIMFPESHKGNSRMKNRIEIHP